MSYRNIIIFINIALLFFVLILLFPNVVLFEFFAKTTTVVTALFSYNLFRQFLAKKRSTLTEDIEKRMPKSINITQNKGRIESDSRSNTNNKKSKNERKNKVESKNEKTERIVTSNSKESYKFIPISFIFLLAFVFLIWGSNILSFVKEKVSNYNSITQYHLQLTIGFFLLIAVIFSYYLNKENKLSWDVIKDTRQLKIFTPAFCLAFPLWDETLTIFSIPEEMILIYSKLFYLGGMILLATFLVYVLFKKPNKTAKVEVSGFAHGSKNVVSSEPVKNSLLKIIIAVELVAYSIVFGSLFDIGLMAI